MIVFWFVLGLVIGSFLNVLIYRLPRRESVVFPPSHCPACGKRLGVGELIPVLSFVLQRGRCRHCGSSVSLQYPLVELLTGLAFALIGLWAAGWGQLIAGLVLFSLVFSAGLCDWHHKLLPNALTLPGIGLGVALSLLDGTIPWTDSLLGGLVGGGVLLLLAVLSKGGMGIGDVKFLAMIGTFVGVWGVLLVLFAASAVGSVYGLTMLYVTKQDKKTPIPFGPFLALGAALVFFGPW